jgi:hypothetical protein
MCVSTESAIETRIKSLSGHNIGASSGAVRKMQHGAFYRKVLSTACDDGKLGENDKYAVEFGRTFKANRVEPLPSAFLVGNMDGEMLAKFALAVPWRASATARADLRRRVGGSLRENVAALAESGRPERG